MNRSNKSRSSTLAPCSALSRCKCRRIRAAWPVVMMETPRLGNSQIQILVLNSTAIKTENRSNYLKRMRRSCKVGLFQIGHHVLHQPFEVILDFVMRQTGPANLDIGYVKSHLLVKF